MKDFIDKRNYYFQNKIIYPSGDLVNILNEIDEETKKGKHHILITKYQLKYGKSLSCNINIPYRKGKNIRDLIIINNPDDSERLVNTHLKKMPNLKPFLYDSIISTTDIDHWKQQRKHFQQAFSISNELRKIIPISNERAKYCNKIIRSYGIKNINISEFFLNETQAQLQLALFGFSNQFQEETNKKIRDAFNDMNVSYATKFAFDLLNETKKTQGPLSKVLNTRKPLTKTERFGNALIFSFAGHDTTGNTLTWLIYELCNNLKIQKRLQKEINLFWHLQKNKPIKYEDLKKLPFMTRCIMETLRLWSPIPNGTFRELSEDDYIIGINNQKVFLPKGTYIQIPNWSRHRNTELWGGDANIFNPDREFREDELWNETVINSYNPSSKRFSPFTYEPRDCIGKNFAQIEMRLILLHILQNNTFIFSEKQKYNQKDIGLNKFTLGPRDMYNETEIGLYVDIIPIYDYSKL